MPEEQKLSNLAKGLNDRPALKMELTAYVDPEKDPGIVGSWLELQVLAR